MNGTLWKKKNQKKQILKKKKKIGTGFAELHTNCYLYYLSFGRLRSFYKAIC